MGPIHKIMVGLDLTDEGELSDGSLLALTHGEWLAGKTGAALTFVHSTREDEHWDPSADAFFRAANNGSLDQPEPLSAALGRLKEAGIETNLVETDETAWLAIVRKTIADETDVIIVGKRTDAKHDGRRLGSVSFKLLRQSPCAVWVAKPGSPTTPRVVLAASDGTPVGQKALRWAAWIAEAAGAELHVVNAIQMPMDVQMEGLDAEASWIDDARAAFKREVAEQLTSAGLSIEAEIHAGMTTPTHAVLECVGRLDPDIVAMGTVSRGGIAGLLVGNTAERLLGRLDCSIVAVKPDDFIAPVAR